MEKGEEQCIVSEVGMSKIIQGFVSHRKESGFYSVCDGRPIVFSIGSNRV